MTRHTGHRLNATVYDDRHSLSRIDCVAQCVTEPCCRSINYRKRDPFNGKENCELLHAVASEQPAEDLKEDKGYDYEILLQPNRPFDCQCSSCKNNGSCETSKKLCSCDSGFNGTQCEKDVDECANRSNSCHQNSTCKNTVGSFTCTCNQGFTGSGTNCTDVHECSSGSNHCHLNSTCNNTVGSYTCTCNQGYTGNGTNCTDVNECNNSNSCPKNSTCNNTVGSYTCTCYQGFTGNGTNCTDIDECSLSSNHCHQNSTCKNTIGSYTCTCNQGFTGNGTNCTGTFVAKFTNLGASGRLGPTPLGSFYAGQDHENMVKVVNGTQYWTVPFTGTYQITVVGASGGYDKAGPTASGRGAYVNGDFDLNKGEVIKILVGQQGVENPTYSSAGGGGGTFVVTSSNKPVIIAGGGGGMEYLRTRLSNCDASVGTSGKKNQCYNTKNICSSWSGGVNGSGALEADNSNSGGGGGGFYSNGRSGQNFGGQYGKGGEGGKSFLQGGAGGHAKHHNAVGGFGGGGGAYGLGGGAGGGGGYSGGASGDNTYYSCAGGGGSYNSGRNQENSEGFQDNGHGYVQINRIFPDV